MYTNVCEFVYLYTNLYTTRNDAMYTRLTSMFTEMLTKSGKFTGRLQVYIFFSFRPLSLNSHTITDNLLGVHKKILEKE
jgi:hypothetical protein